MVCERDQEQEWVAEGGAGGGDDGGEGDGGERGGAGDCG